MLERSKTALRRQTVAQCSHYTRGDGECFSVIVGVTLIHQITVVIPHTRTKVAPVNMLGKRACCYALQKSWVVVQQLFA
jgi:hypothetical protein